MKETFVSADGITYSFGVFLVELIEDLKADRGATSFIPSILVGVTLGSGQSAPSQSCDVRLLDNDDQADFYYLN